MINNFKKVSINPLFSGSLIVVFGSNMINALNYIYHLLMGRVLGPENYGDLATIIAFISFLSIIPFSLNFVVIKFASSAKNDEEIRHLIGWLNKKVLLVGISISVLIILFSPIFSSFLSIKNYYLIPLAGLVFIFSLPSLLYKSALQGVLMFKEQVLSSLVETGIKLVLGIVLIYLSFSVLGAVAALVIASIVGFVISRFYITKYIQKDYDSIDRKARALFMYSIPILVQSLAMASIFSMDLILVKHFFSSTNAGMYAALSTLAKIIFFAAGPISAVMFPMIARKHALGEDYRGVFIYSLVLTTIICLSIAGLYWLLPNLAIQILYGSAYLGGAPILGLFGLFISFYSVSSLFISYYLSLNQTKVVILPAIAAVMQILGIYTFHDSLYQVVVVCTVISALLLATLFVYFLRQLIKP